MRRNFGLNYLFFFCLKLTNIGRKRSGILDPAFSDYDGWESYTFYVLASSMLAHTLCAIHCVQTHCVHFHCGHAHCVIHTLCIHTVCNTQCVHTHFVHAWDGKNLRGTNKECNFRRRTSDLLTTYNVQTERLEKDCYPRWSQSDWYEKYLLSQTMVAILVTQKIPIFPWC